VLGDDFEVMLSVVWGLAYDIPESALIKLGEDALQVNVMPAPQGMRKIQSGAGSTWKKG
jgi:hypothetical protein